MIERIEPSQEFEKFFTLYRDLLNCAAGINAYDDLRANQLAFPNLFQPGESPLDRYTGKVDIVAAKLTAKDVYTVEPGPLELEPRITQAMYEAHPVMKYKNSAGTVTYVVQDRELIQELTNERE